MAAKKSGLLIALVLIVLAAIAGGGGWMWLNRDAQGTATAQGAADQPLTGTLPASTNAAAPTPTPAPRPAAPAEQFTEAAVIDDPNGYTNVRSGPSTVAPSIARVSAGETFRTYEQGGDWWRVRTEGGLIGYMPRLRIRLRGAAPPLPGETPATATADVASAAETSEPGAAPARPKQREPRSRINRRNSENMRLFCQNAGRGTPPCRRFRALGGR